VLAAVANRRDDRPPVMSRRTSSTQRELHARRASLAVAPLEPIAPCAPAVPVTPVTPDGPASSRILLRRARHLLTGCPREATMTDEPTSGADSNRPPLLNEAVRRVLDWHRLHAAPLRDGAAGADAPVEAGGGLAGVAKPAVPDRDGAPRSA
jgi:hypothetical protein